MPDPDICKSLALCPKLHTLHLAGREFGQINKPLNIGLFKDLQALSIVGIPGIFEGEPGTWETLGVHIGRTLPKSPGLLHFHCQSTTAPKETDEVLEEDIFRILFPDEASAQVHCFTQFSVQNVWFQDKNYDQFSIFKLLSTNLREMDCLLMHGCNYFEVADMVVLSPLCGWLKKLRITEWEFLEVKNIHVFIENILADALDGPLEELEVHIADASARKFEPNVSSPILDALCSLRPCGTALRLLKITDKLRTVLSLDTLKKFESISFSGQLQDVSLHIPTEDGSEKSLVPFFITIDFVTLTFEIG
jgi:hypothetical protein